MTKYKKRFFYNRTNVTICESPLFIDEEDAEEWIPDIDRLSEPAKQWFPKAGELEADDLNILHTIRDSEIIKVKTNTYLLATVYDDRDERVIEQKKCSTRHEADSFVDMVYGMFTDPDDGVRPLHMTYKIEEVDE